MWSEAAILFLCLHNNTDIVFYPFLSTLSTRDYTFYSIKVQSLADDVLMTLMMSKIFGRMHPSSKMAALIGRTNLACQK